MGCLDHQTAMSTKRACVQCGAALAQPIPLTVAVDQDATLVKYALQKKWCLRLDPLETGDVNPATADALQADGQPKVCRGAIASERDQQIEIGVRVRVSSRQRAVEHGQANPMLSPQRPTKR
jgi:hypothetical protein